MLKSKRRILASLDTVPLLTLFNADLPNTFSRESQCYTFRTSRPFSLIPCLTDIRVMLDAIVPRAYDYVYCRVSSATLKAPSSAHASFGCSTISRMART